MRIILVLAVLFFLVLTSTTGMASACRDNSWQPTYVHDLVNNNPVPYYVMPDGSFVALTGDWANQSGPGMCCLYGVRDKRGFTNCFEYTRVQCGCDMQSLANDTCARFLAEQGVTGAGGGTGGGRGGGSISNCDEYARIGVEQTRRYKAGGCSGGDPSWWTEDYNRHKNWCDTNPRNPTPAEGTASRENVLRGCYAGTGGRIVSCDQYARTGVEQTRRYKAGGCSGGDPNWWTEDYNRHKNWCDTNPSNPTPAEGTRLREQVLQECSGR